MRWNLIYSLTTGREVAAWLGLVPRQHSTGGKSTLGGINKRGDKYLRTLLIHGARSALVHAEKKQHLMTIGRIDWLEGVTIMW